MRTALSLLVLATLAFAGCINPAQPAPLDAASAPPAETPAALEPVTVTWRGHITASPLGALAHTRETESAAVPIQAEGFVFQVKEVPTSMMVDLHWPGPGTALVMVSTPHKEGKGFEYFTEMSSEAHQCLAIPPMEIEAGDWQVMIHTDQSAMADFDFEVTTVGGVAAILEGAPHSSAEAAQTENREALPCPDMGEQHA